MTVAWPAFTSTSAYVYEGLHAVTGKSRTGSDSQLKNREYGHDIKRCSSGADRNG